MELHYLDNAATTRVSERAARAAFDAMRINFGNPSSMHALGIAAADLLEASRARMKELVSGTGTVIFTSGGTESDNLAIRGAVKAGERRGKHVVSTAIEHPAVLETLKALERDGTISLTLVAPDKNGVVPVEKIDGALREDTVLLSMMLVNNETGAIQPVKEAAAIAKEKNPACLVHTDAVQGLGKLDLNVGADLVSVSGHKIHGPKGVGALLVKKGARILPVLTGGGQEGNLRSGTESLPLIAAFAEALAELKEDTGASTRISKLRAYLEATLREKLPQAVLLAEGVPQILCLSLIGARSEVLMRMLEERGVYVSSGSACSRGRRSHVLAAMGLDSKFIDGAIRVSMSRETTKDDIDALVGGLQDAALRLRL
jgi:cysteine desulfurase